MPAKPVVIADDHPLFRAALLQAIKGAAPDREIVETGSVGAARSAIDTHGPGLLCLDLHMEDSDGFAALIELKQSYPGLPIAVVSGSEGGDVAGRALAFGASAFIPKSLGIDEIRTAITTVLEGDIWSPANGGTGGTDDDLAERLASLTPTQLKVLLGVQKGLLNKQIAYELSISEATVKAHLTAIFRKLNVLTRTQAVLAAGALLVERPQPGDDQ